MIGMKRNQMIIDVLVLPLLPKQKKTTKKKVMSLMGQQPCCCSYCRGDDWPIILIEREEGKDGKHLCC